MIDYTLLSCEKCKSPADRRGQTGLHLKRGCLLAKRVSNQPTNRSANLHVSKSARDIRRHIRAADPNSWREAFALVPPLTPMRLTEKTQMFSISKNIHGDPRTLRNKPRYS